MSMSFLCTPCNCTFPLAYLTDTAIANLWTHLNGNLHKQSCCWSKLQCLLCTETICTSGDIRTDGYRAENHIKSYSHQINVKKHYDDNYTNNNDSNSGSYYDTTESDQSDDNDDDYEDDDDLPPSTMSFLCTPCDSYFPMSYNTDKTIDNLWTHLNGNQHEQNRCYSTLQCILCSETINTSGNLKIDGERAENHINSYSHRMNAKNHYDDYHTNNNDSDNGSSSYDTTEPDQSDDYNDESEEENNSWFFYCCICSCDIQVSSDVGKTLKQLQCHIEGQQHKNNINQSGVEKSMICNTCDRPISVSIDINSSLRNLHQHINSC